MKTTKRKIMDLAVAYSAFNEARKAEADNATAVWGDMLLDAQARLGIELVEPELTARIVGYCRERLNAAKVAARKE